MLRKRDGGEISIYGNDNCVKDMIESDGYGMGLLKELIMFRVWFVHGWPTRLLHQTHGWTFAEYNSVSKGGFFYYKKIILTDIFYFIY